jgi:HAD superfamily hydrolase (TIGR01509 family)
MLKALLFDMDGTLADTDPLHFETYKTALAGRGIHIDRNAYDRHISGRSNEECMARLLPDGTEVEKNAIADHKERLFRETLETQAPETLAPTPGTMDLLAWAAENALVSALVTSAPPENVDSVLACLGLIGRFDVVIARNDVKLTKPDPFPFRLALERLGVEAASGLAFEDSTSGVRSAIGAGMVTVALTTTQDAATLREIGADLVIADFTDSRLWSLLQERLSG